MLLFTPVACGYTLNHNYRSPSFASNPQIRSSSSSRDLYRADVDTPALDEISTAIGSLSSTISRMKNSAIINKKVCSLREAEGEHGMPWTDSIDPQVGDDLLYMEFWKWQMKFMEDNLTDLQVMS